MKCAPVALFTAEQDKGVLRFANIIGLLQLDMDRHFKNSFLRIYDLQTLAMSFEIEMYYGFGENYRMITNTLYAFDYPRGIIAFMFRNKQQADIFAIKIKSSAPSMKDY